MLPFCGPKFLLIQISGSYSIEYILVDSKRADWHLKIGLVASGYRFLLPGTAKLLKDACLAPF
jgi:hypothetical protein